LQTPGTVSGVSLTKKILSTAPGVGTAATIIEAGSNAIAGDGVGAAVVVAQESVEGTVTAGFTGLCGPWCGAAAWVGMQTPPGQRAGQALVTGSRETYQRVERDTYNSFVLYFIPPELWQYFR